MLLAVDVGNTNIKLGVFDGSELRASWRWATDPSRLSDEYGAQLGWLLEHAEIAPAGIHRMVLSSVVPQLTGTLQQVARQYLGSEPLTVSAGLQLGLRLAVDNPREVGADRIANAIAVGTLYRAPAVVVDFGTATNFDVVDANGDFIGSCFAPGLQTAVDGLLARAARLQPFELMAPPRVIGTNTVACLQAGTIFGYVGLVEGLLRRIEKELGQAPQVVGTGGQVELIANETDAIQIVDPHLTLKGLRLLADRNPIEGT
jgi:type III pantothenate kinase